MLANKKVAIIGVGKMGGTLVNSMLKNKSVRKKIYMEALLKKSTQKR